MGKEIVAFGDIEIEKGKFNYRKNLILLEDIKKIQVSNMVSIGGNIYKYFIGYEDDDHKIKPLRIKLPKPSAYVKSYDGETKWMYFFIENDAY